MQGLKALIGVTVAKAGKVTDISQRITVVDRATTEKGRLSSKEIIQDLNGKALDVPLSYLVAEGLTRLVVVEMDEGTMGANLVDRKVPAWNKLDRDASFDDSDGIVVFNPAFYDRQTRSVQLISTEHELWHLILNRSLPGYQSDFNVLFFLTKLQCPILSVFWRRLEHFHLKIAALEAGRDNFVLQEDSFLFQEDMIPLANEQLASLTEFTMWLLDVLFQNVFPFRGYPAMSARMEQNLESLRRAALTKTDDQTFRLVYELGEKVLAAIATDDIDIQPTSFGNNILAILMPWIRSHDSLSLL